MKLDFGSEVPIYLQLARSVEDDIVNGVFPEDTQIPSTTEISVLYKVNPATVGKGFNLLVEENVIYKKRGVGMFVTQGARSRLIAKRREEFYGRYIEGMLEEARRLGIRKEEIIEMLKRGGNDE